MSLDILAIGPMAFGAVVGWCAGVALDGQSKFGITQLGTLIGVLAGGMITVRFGSQGLFAWFCIGLAPAFFAHRFLNIPKIKRKIIAEAIGELRQSNIRDKG